MGFAGCWKDMPGSMFGEFLQEIAQRRSHAFSRRGHGETSIIGKIEGLEIEDWSEEKGLK